MKFIYTALLVIFYIVAVCAQSKISLYTGWTASKIQVSYPESIRPGSAFGDFTEFTVLHAPYYGGLEYEYDCNKLRLSTGLSFMAFGSSSSIMFKDAPWIAYYWIVPILTGYHVHMPHQLELTIEGGVDIGFQQGNSDLIGVGATWGNVNAVLAVEGGWKNFRLGVRGHLGLTDFRKFSNFTYRHTGITTYLGYTLWDHAKCKARRLQKQQERQIAF